jgi:hypothetical protein
LATLERLFGSLDYCACEECRSVIGPAAYLVDLLNFTDCASPPPKSANPQDVLFGRRPDLQYLPLTCANTNTALPYIDLVNEILEYFAAHGALTGFKGYTTDETLTSDELLAIPQNPDPTTRDAAYANLSTQLFPPPLPFHRPVELLRRLFRQFDIALSDAMVALRSSDAIERGSSTYGWRDILMEQLGLSRAEYQILTDSSLGLAQLYGYPTGAAGRADDRRPGERRDLPAAHRRLLRRAAGAAHHPLHQPQRLSDPADRKAQRRHGCRGGAEERRDQRP